MFLRLTTVNDKKIYINSDLIESFGTITKKSYVCAEEYLGHTFVIVNGMSAEENPYIVKEFPDEIIAKIEKWGA